MSESFQIIEEKPDHHFRTEIPNIVFELDLSSFELSLYLIIKKITGDDGCCWRSLSSLSELARMSKTKVRECLDKLCSPFAKLSNLPLLKKYARHRADGTSDTNVIEVVPIWRNNGDFYRLKKKLQCSLGEGYRSPHGRYGSPGDYKEELNNKKNSSVCSDSPVAKSHVKTSVVILHPSGTQENLMISDIFSLAIRKKENWTTQEIDLIWDILTKYQKPIANLYSFIRGTINNFRSKELAKKINKTGDKYSVRKKKKTQDALEVGNKSSVHMPFIAPGRKINIKY